MSALVVMILSCIGLLLLVVVGVLLVEVGAAWLLPARPDEASHKRPRIGVVVPAHNEAAGIAKVVQAIKTELAAGDRLVVVADNCSDDTYALALAAGADAVRRNDPSRRGKGFALDCGVRHLAADPPDVVIIMDADCYASPGSLARIAGRAMVSARPVQAYYQMGLPKDLRSSSMVVAAFAWRVKNLIRPLGLHRLGLPCQLTGTGMAFPWSAISRARLGTSQIVEDLVLGLELARDGTPPLFCPEAHVASEFPVNQEGQSIQRARWETGHLNTITGKLPGLFVEALRTGNLGLLTLVADAAVPPLAFLALLLTGFLFASLLALAVGGSYLPAGLALLCLALLAASVFIAWLQAEGEEFSSANLAMVPAYALGKVGIYCRIVIGRQLEWVRTKRD